MKKGVIIILIIVVLLAIACFIPITQKTDINISATFDNTVLQVIHLENWKNWYPELRNAYANDSVNYSFAKDTAQKIYTLITTDKKYIIHSITPTSYQVSEEKGNWVDVFAFTVFPSDTLGKMKINMVKKTPLLFALFNKSNAGENAINGLKSYLEDPKAFYGFKIEMGKIRDSVLASIIFKTIKKDVLVKIHDAYLNLLGYTKKNGLAITDHTSISYIPISDDSFQITVGVPVNKFAPPLKEINCLLLPAQGNVIVGNYEGKFSERRKIYLAMIRYMADHTLTAPAESFERYLNDSIPLSDSSMIKMELNYPVY
jgi:effector-binding domain-containing protein